MQNFLEIFKSELQKNYNNSAELKSQIETLLNLIIQYKYKSPLTFASFYGLKSLYIIAKSTDVLIKQTVLPLIDNLEKVHDKSTEFKYPLKYVDKIQVPQYYGGISNIKNLDFKNIKQMNLQKKMNFLEENFFTFYLTRSCDLREDFYRKLDNVFEFIEFGILNPIIINTKVVDIRNVSGCLNRKFVLKGDVQFESVFYTSNSSKKQKKLSNYKVEVVFNLEDDEVEEINFIKI